MALKNVRPAKGKKDDVFQEDGIDVHLSHEHLQKLGVKTPPAVGTKVSFHGEGEVTSSHSSDGEGGPKHSMRMTMHKGAEVGSKSPFCGHSPIIHTNWGMSAEGGKTTQPLRTVEYRVVGKGHKLTLAAAYAAWACNDMSDKLLCDIYRAMHLNRPLSDGPV